MPEFISSPIFLIIAAVLAIFIIIGIIKHTWRFLIWAIVIFAILAWLGIVKESELRIWVDNLLNWFENLLKKVE